MVNLLYEFEDSMRGCVVLLEDNFAKLSDYAHDQEIPASEFSETSDKYKYFKKCLDDTKENIISLNSEYSRLNRRYSTLFENNPTKVFLKYAKSQESLRLKFIKTIFECKRVNRCLEMIKNGLPITISNEDFIPSPLKRFRAAYKDFSSNVELESDNALVSKMDTSPTERVPSGSDPHIENNNEVDINEITESVAEKEEISPALFPIFSDVVVTGMPNSSFSPLNNDVLVGECDTTSLELEVDKPEQDKVSNQQPVHVCNICSRIFQKREKLRRHEFLHTGMKPFSCTTCGASFARRDYLTAHLRSQHKIGKPVCKCDVCGKRCSNSSALKFHKRTHEKSLKTCILCVHSFKERKEFIDHMAVKHSVSVGCEESVQYRCSHCGQHCQSCEDFLKHLKDVHHL